MILLDPTFIRDSVDYSFGDQSGTGLWNGYMREANLDNEGFIEKYNEIKEKRNIMTLFIDNIRLYRRPGIKYTAMEQSNPMFKAFKDKRVNELSKNDLLDACSKLTDMNFVIFTGFEDTPIDEEIFDRIPNNVLGIYASNAMAFGDKVYPIPYGLQRKIYPTDNRHEHLISLLDIKIKPTKLLYINHSITNPERININKYFQDKSWVTIESPKSIGLQDYVPYINTIRDHKFMICPGGNAIGCECHRDWEVLYSRRVPVVERSNYLEVIFKDIPVLFVNSFYDVTEELLLNNVHLFDEMQNFDLNKLDIQIIYNNILKEYGL